MNNIPKDILAVGFRLLSRHGVLLLWASILLNACLTSSVLAQYSGPHITSVTGMNPQIPVGGHEIFINGSDFYPGLFVTIGGVNPSCAIHSSSLLSCIAPTHTAGSYDVRVENYDTLSDTLVGGMVYEDLPTVTSVSPLVGVNPSGGEVITVQGTNLKVGANGVKVDGVFLTTTGTSTEVTFVAPAHAVGNAALVVYSPNGNDSNFLNNSIYPLVYGTPTISSVEGANPQLAGGSREIVIRGNNFRSDATVHIGGVAATDITVRNNGSEISATPPAYPAGSYDVTVTNPGSQSVTATAAMSYEDPPTVTSVSPSSGLNPAGGTVVTLTGTGLGPGLFLDPSGTNEVVFFTSTSPTQATFTAPAHATGAYQIVVYGLNGTPFNGLTVLYSGLTYGFNLSGTVTHDGVGLSGVAVDGGPLGSTTTDSNGRYSFTGLSNGAAYSLTPTKSGYTISPSTISGTISSNTTQNFTAAPPGFDIRGSVKLNDATGSPLSGVVVTDGTREATTDSSGNFILESVPAGSYTLSASKSGYSLNANESVNPVVVGSSEVTGKDFTAAPALISPIYGIWDGQLSMGNVAELLNTGEQPITVSMLLIDSGGAEAGEATTITIPSKSQKNVNLNKLPGFSAGASGTIRFSFSDSTFDGRILYSRKSKKDKGSLDYVFSSPLTNPLSGKGYVTFNTVQPSSSASEAAFVVSHWLTLVNLADATKSFTINRYSNKGELLKTETQTLQARALLVLEAGHVTPGPNAVGLIEVVPDDLSSNYLTTLVRYGSDSPTGDNAQNYQFALSLPGLAANNTISYIPVTNRTGFENYVELTNVGSSEVAVTTESYDSKGNLVDDSVIILPPRQQEYIYASVFMPKGLTGYVVFRPATSNSIVAYSVVYKRKGKSGKIIAAHTSPSVGSYGAQIFGSYDLRLKLTNWLSLINVTGESATATIRAPLNTEAAGETVTLPPHSRVNLDLRKRKNLGIKPGKFGILELTTESSGAVFGEVVREKSVTSSENPTDGKKPSKELDYSVTTPIR